MCTILCYANLVEFPSPRCWPCRGHSSFTVHHTQQQDEVLSHLLSFYSHKYSCKQGFSLLGILAEEWRFILYRLQYNNIQSVDFQTHYQSWLFYLYLYISNILIIIMYNMLSNTKTKQKNNEVPNYSLWKPIECSCGPPDADTFSDSVSVVEAMTLINDMFVDSEPCAAAVC